jgi:hypothetical protein
MHEPWVKPDWVFVIMKIRYCQKIWHKFDIFKSAMSPTMQLYCKYNTATINSTTGCIKKTESSHEV